jgi:hypothetical protein
MSNWLVKKTQMTTEARYLHYYLHDQQNCAAITRTGAAAHVVPKVIQKPRQQHNRTRKTNAQGYDEWGVNDGHGDAVGYNCREQKQRVDQQTKAMPFVPVEHLEIKSHEHAAFMNKAGHEKQRKKHWAAAQNNSNVERLIQQPWLASEKTQGVRVQCIVFAMQHALKEENIVRNMKDRVVENKERVTKAHNIVLQKMSPEWQRLLVATFS